MTRCPATDNRAPLAFIFSENVFDCADTKVDYFPLLTVTVVGKKTNTAATFHSDIPSLKQSIDNGRAVVFCVPWRMKENISSLDKTCLAILRTSAFLRTRKIHLTLS